MEKTNEEEVDELLKETETFHTLSAPTVGKHHNWKQMGQELICSECESSHGFRLKYGHQMTGIDEFGLPTVVKMW